jgi:hypothetical protein
MDTATDVTSPCCHDDKCKFTLLTAMHTALHGMRLNWAFASEPPAGNVRPWCRIQP